MSWMTFLSGETVALRAIGEEDAPLLKRTINDPRVRRGVAEVGYIIIPEAWGEGHATEAVRLLCEYAFSERRLNKVVSSVYETNPASARVLEKVGFRREVVLRREAFLDAEYVDLRRYGCCPRRETSVSRAEARRKTGQKG